jgi:hypothetical protein
MGEKHYFDRQLSKRGKAEEDLWFARRDRELIEAQQRQQIKDAEEDAGKAAETGHEP